MWNSEIKLFNIYRASRDKVTDNIVKANAIAKLYMRNVFERVTGLSAIKTYLNTIYCLKQLNPGGKFDKLSKKGFDTNFTIMQPQKVATTLEANFEPNPKNDSWLSLRLPYMYVMNYKCDKEIYLFHYNNDIDNYSDNTNLCYTDNVIWTHSSYMWTYRSFDKLYIIRLPPNTPFGIEANFYKLSRFSLHEGIVFIKSTDKADVNKLVKIDEKQNEEVIKDLEINNFTVTNKMIFKYQEIDFYNVYFEIDGEFYIPSDMPLNYTVIIPPSKFKIINRVKTKPIELDTDIVEPQLVTYLELVEVVGMKQTTPDTLDTDLKAIHEAMPYKR